MGTLVAEPVKILSIEIPKFVLGFPKNTQEQDNEIPIFSISLGMLFQAPT